MRIFSGLLAVLIAACGNITPRSLQEPSEISRADAQLQARVEAFLSAVDSLAPDQLRTFFPQTGNFTYRRTVYSDETRGSEEWQFPAAELPMALAGPLEIVLTVAHEDQTIGLFAHQVRLRRGLWRNIGGNRFVPPGADATSAVYVEWRLENEKWVISTLADEQFKTESLPDWCC